MSDTGAQLAARKVGNGQAEIFFERTIGLVRYDLMLSAINECHRIDDAREIVNKVEALRAYAYQAGDVVAEKKLAQIRMRAERRAGELLREMKDTGERDAGGRGRIEFREGTQLADLGISKKKSFLWQKLAQIPEETFEALLAERHSAYEILRKEKIKESDAEHPWWEEHWQGMPEFVQEDLTPHRTIHVHFANDDAVAAFAERVDQNITPKTRYIHFSTAEVERGAEKKCVDMVAPTEFPVCDPDVETEFKCPHCGYEWNGKARPEEVDD